MRAPKISDEQAIIEQAQNKLLYYAALQFPGYIFGKHHTLIAQHLEMVEQRKITRLMINLAPRHGKTMLVSEFFGAWYLGKNPEHQVIASTYAKDRAEDTGLKIKQLIEDPVHKMIFPECILKKDSRSKTKLTSTKGGNYFSVGVGGAITGRGAHLLLLDDLIKSRDEADSVTAKRRLGKWYKGTAYTRLMPGGVIVFISTRWSHDDLAGELLSEEGDDWVVLNLPALAEPIKGEKLDIIGRKDGEALWPEKYPKKTLEQIKQTIGTREWNAQYQGRPVGEEGGMIKLEWLEGINGNRQYANPPESPPAKIIQSWDTAYSEKEINDPSCCLTIAEYNGYYYILDRFMKNLDYPGVRKAILDQYNEWKPSIVLMENRASGQSLVQEFKNTTIPIKPITPTSMQSKLIRLNDVSGMIEAGKILTPKVAPWLTDFYTNLISFPYGVRDDDVDALSQFLHWARGARKRKRSGPKYWK
jgi:predicted phage terminase large subunit-like protein